MTKDYGEPWSIGCRTQRSVFIDNAGGITVAAAAQQLFDEANNAETAERIVACVNAMAGRDPFVVTIAEAKETLRKPDIGFIQPIDGKWRFARRENGHCYWCVESKEEALQLASNLLHIAVLMEDWDD